MEAPNQPHPTYVPTACHLAFEFFGIALSTSLVALLLWRC